MLINPHHDDEVSPNLAKLQQWDCHIITQTYFPTLIFKLYWKAQTKDIEIEAHFDLLSTYTLSSLCGFKQERKQHNSVASFLGGGEATALII